MSAIETTSPDLADVPRGLRPMLMRAGDLPGNAGWSFEPKWDGFRALVHIGDAWRSPRIVSRHGTDLTSRFPELAGLADVGQGRRLVLDGELIVCGDDGRPDFDRLRNRMTIGSVRLRRAAAAAPATFVAFDVLWCDGDRTDETYTQRRTRLLDLGLDGDRWQVTPAEADGAALWAAVHDHELEGLVAKRLSSRYQPGRRTSEWIKVKRWQHCEAFVGGFTIGRTGNVRSLLVGLESDAGDAQLALGGQTPTLRYIGEVEYGFAREDRPDLAALLAPLARPVTPFGIATRHEHVVHVDPTVRVTVQFQCWSEGRLRHPVFRGVVAA